MHIVLLHHAFPGQFKNLLLTLPQDSRCKLTFLTERAPKDQYLKGQRGIQVLDYSIENRIEKGDSKDEPPTSILTAGGRRGLAVADALHRLKTEGHQPDLILAHPGWGEQLYVRDVLGDVPIISWAEFYSNYQSAILNFDPSFPIGYKMRALGTSQNAFMIAGLTDADAAITAMDWQKAQFPIQFADRIHVIHEGVNTDYFAPASGEQPVIELPDGQRLSMDDQVITYAARGLEPLRGLHIMLQVAALLCDRHPHARILILGDEFQTYAPPPTGFASWLQLFKPTVQLDPTRVFFLGSLPYNQYRKVLQLSSAHIYLTYPFVLSWSLLEAMSVGCAIVGSATDPVLEVLKEGWNGLLADFFSPTQIADQVDVILDQKIDVRKLRNNARSTVLEAFEMNHCVAKQVALFNSLLNSDQQIVLNPKLGSC
jgi:glycosyltransferase involved in cell wall biosynthesis